MSKDEIRIGSNKTAKMGFVGGIVLMILAATANVLYWKVMEPNANFFFGLALFLPWYAISAGTILKFYNSRLSTTLSIGGMVCIPVGLAVIIWMSRMGG